MTIDRINQPGRVNQTEAGKDHVTRSRPGNTKDSVSISHEAMQKAEFRRALDMVKQAPDIRADKVELAKRNLESYFDGDLIKPEVLEALSAQILRRTRL